MLCGDPSDDIHGIRGLGLKKLIKLFPDIQQRPITISEIKTTSNLLLEDDRDNYLLKNLLTGVTKIGVFGDEYFHVMEQLIELTNPILTQEAKETINLLISDILDPDGRSYKNIMKYMMEDGIYNLLPRSEDGFSNFMRPFLILTRKEKNKTRTKTIKFNDYE